MSEQPFLLDYGVREEIPGIQSSSDSGGTISFIIVDGRFIAVPASQEWFWTPEWQARHEKSIHEMETGQYMEFDDGESFVASLVDMIDE